jgi:thiamine transport system substrate-binding protein
MKYKNKTFAAALTVACAVFMLLASCQAKNKNELIVWTYDSFNSEWGPGAEIGKKFYEKTGITIKWESSGDAGSLLSRVLLEGQDAKQGADIMLGIDQNLLPRAAASGLFESYKPKGAEAIFGELLIDDTYTFIPFDYSYFSIVYDSEKITNPPRSLEDLTKDEYKKSIILIDPRTSSPGLGFLGWTINEYKDAWPQYWQRLMPSVLTIAPGWDTAYGLFTKGEAPMVLSYTTSPGYHLEYENSERYRAALFDGGHPIQIELAAILKTAPHKKAAKEFMDFMISEDFQSEIPLTNWMYTVIDMPLPESFRINTKPDITLHTTAVTEEDIYKWTEVAQ